MVLLHQTNKYDVIAACKNKTWNTLSMLTCFDFEAVEIMIPLASKQHWTAPNATMQLLKIPKKFWGHIL